MKLIVQRVTRATIEVDGVVENRIGSGLLLSLAVRKGDTAAKAQKLASDVMNLRLWSEMFDTDKKWASSVVDNGFEVLAILQQSLCASFPEGQRTPNEQAAMEEGAASSIFDAFVQALQSAYSIEMVVGAPTGTPLKVEATNDGPCIFELQAGAEPAAAMAPPRAAPPTMTKAAAAFAPVQTLKPEVKSVTEALGRLRLLVKSKATLESCKIFRIFSTKQFRESLSDAEQSDTDVFAEALDAAGHFFSEKQQGQITEWTGLTITPAEPGMEDVAGESVEDEEAAMERQMAELRGEEQSANEAGLREKPDWFGRAAPNTPAKGGKAKGKHQQDGFKGGANAMKGGKGVGRPRPRNWGIASLDDSARLHGQGQGDYGWAQHAAMPDAGIRARVMKQENGGEAGAKRMALTDGPAAVLKRPKGTPTVAPMCPAANAKADYDEL